MGNNTGIETTEYGSRNQILANVDLQAAFGCIVGTDLGVTVDNRKIVKAGTPLHVDYTDLQEPASAASGTSAMNAVLLHDVDVTNGSNNGTALIFGFVNVNRLDTDVQALVTAAVGNANASRQITFLNL